MSNFALGIALPTGTISPYGPFNITLPTQLQHPQAGNFGSGTTITWFSDIRAPNVVELTPAAPIGTDLYGRPTVIGYDRMLWGYNRLPSDEWYYLIALFRLARRAVAGKAAHVRIQWPDPESGQVQETSARWQPIQTVERHVGDMERVQLVFTMLGVDDTTITGAWRPPLLPTPTNTND